MDFTKLNTDSTFKGQEELRFKIMRIINPIISSDKKNSSNKSMPSTRTQAGRNLAESYYVYFLLVKLLKFKNWGRCDKIAWTIPIEFNGKFFLIEHRKFGLGIFSDGTEESEKEAVIIANKINKAVKQSHQFYKWIAHQAAQESKLNVLNQSRYLYERFSYFNEMFKEMVLKEKELIEKKGNQPRSHLNLPLVKNKNLKWVALSSIDCFFSWTEHIFIHLAILSGTAITGIEVADLAQANWKDKFNKAVPTKDPKLKKLFDELIIIRKQLRNFVAHGAFGNQGEAFHFHSIVGTVPLQLSHDNNRFTIGEGLYFDEVSALQVIEDFIEYLWKDREPARLYIQESSLPLILTLAKDGTYMTAMSSISNMNGLIQHLIEIESRSMDMDW